MGEFHQGRALREAVDAQPKPITEIADMLSVHRDTIHRLFDKPILKKSRILQFERIGIYLKVPVEAPKGEDSAYIKRLEMDIDSLKEVVASQKETIQAQNQAMESKDMIIKNLKAKKKVH